MVEKISWPKTAIEDKIRTPEYWYMRIGTKTYSKKT
jgi:hypothetical protein